MKYLVAILMMLIPMVACTSTQHPMTSQTQPSDNKTIEIVPTSSNQTISMKIRFDRRGILCSSNIDGTELKKEFSRPTNESPDGKTLVFAGQTDFNYRALYLSNIDGTNSKPIIPIGGGLPDHMCPTWSPDGSKIAYSKSQSHAGTGRYLYYDIWVMNPDGTEIKRIADTSPTSNPRSHTCPQWFPDSKKVIYASNENGYWEIYSTPIDYYEPTLIVKLQQNFKPGEVPWNYKISPDGKRMIYADGPDTDIKTMVIDLSTKKVMEWPNIDITAIPPFKSKDGSITVITKSDGLYYTVNMEKEPLKIPSTTAGDIAMGFEE